MTPHAHFWTQEKAHWLTIKTLPRIWLSVLTLLAFCLNPLLPCVAYALQLWASTWNWRDRWASVRALATPGIVFVCCLVVLALLDHAHYWIIPLLINSVQRAWQGHLPGDFSLSPLDLHALVSRLVLLLPLAPSLALLYEYINPRTQTQLRRILRQSDLLPSPIAPPTRQVPEPTLAPAPLSEHPAPSLAKKSATTARKQSAHRKKSEQAEQPATASVEQMTIESFLTPHDQEGQPAVTIHQKTTGTQASKQNLSQHSTPKPKPPNEPIDWENVLE